MNKEIKEVPNSFDHHILLYAKGWYKKSGNVTEDLKILLANYASLSLEHITDNEMKECLAICFAKYCPNYELGRAISEMLGWRWLISTRKPEEIMIGLLSIVEGKYVDPTQLLPVLVKDIKEN